MGTLFIACPTTGNILSTGMSMDKASFESSTLVNNSVGPCPHCGATHTWSKENAMLGKDPGE